MHLHWKRIVFTKIVYLEGNFSKVEWVERGGGVSKSALGTFRSKSPCSHQSRDRQDWRLCVRANNRRLYLHFVEYLMFSNKLYVILPKICYGVLWFRIIIWFGKLSLTYSSISGPIYKATENYCQKLDQVGYESVTAKAH